MRKIIHVLKKYTLATENVMLCFELPEIFPSFWKYWIRTVVLWNFSRICYDSMTATESNQMALFLINFEFYCAQKWDTNFWFFWRVGLRRCIYFIWPLMIRFHICFVIFILVNMFFPLMACTFLSLLVYVVWAHTAVHTLSLAVRWCRGEFTSCPRRHCIGIECVRGTNRNVCIFMRLKHTTSFGNCAIIFYFTSKIQYNNSIYCFPVSDFAINFIL